MTTGTLAVLPRPYDDEDARDDAAVRPLAAAVRPSRFEEEARFAFGDFQLVPRSRVLLRNGRPVCLGSRAFDLLHALLRSAGILVAKEALVKEVWPNTFVDESNLRFQMTGLRKALGNERHVIKTVPGRGYVFTGDCRRADLWSERPAAAQAASARGGAIGRPAQLLPFPNNPSGADPDGEAQAERTGVWLLASLSIVRASTATPAGWAGEAPMSAPQHQDGPEPQRVELLLPVLVLKGHPEGSPGQLPPHSGTAIDLAPLLELLRPALPCPRNG